MWENKKFKTIKLETIEQVKSLPYGTLIVWEHVDHPGVPMVAIRYEEDSIVEFHYIEGTDDEFVSWEEMTYYALVEIDDV